MNYELAKELKEAGFPKEGFVACDGIDCNMKGEPHVFSEPTLSELIEACGHDFISLFRLVHGMKDTQWQARAKVTTKRWIKVFGPTPEEAVARLWLALNPKK